MEGYTADEESCTESQREWSHNSQRMEDMRIPFSGSKQSSIFKMLHGLNLLASPYNVFGHPTMFIFLEGRHMNEQPLIAITTMTVTT